MSRHHPLLSIIGQWVLVTFLLLLLSLQNVQAANNNKITTEDPKEETQSLAAANNDTTLSDKVLLSNGMLMPRLGLGVALTAKDTYDAVQWALSSGYRLIDTAAEESYGNEDQVGRAILDSSVPRDDVFVTTKLWDSDHGFFATLDAFEESYQELNVGTIDLYLMHSPFRGKLVETWDAMLYLQKQGYVRSIGVSNFGIPHLQALQTSGRPLPAVNQIEMHPLVYKQRLPLVDWCRQHGVQIQAYGSLLFGVEEWFSSNLLVDMTTRYHKSTAQILLRWALQHDFLVIPKSSKQHRIVENSLVFDFQLSRADMQTLDDWGDQITQQQRYLYKQDWNWNPIDEAPVRLGKTHYWPKFEGIDEIYFADEEDEDDQEEMESGDEF